MFTRELLTLHPPGHPRRPDPLNNLAATLLRQNDKTHQLEDVEEQIRCDRELVGCRPPGHAARPETLYYLVQSLFSRFSHTRVISPDDLDEVMDLIDEGLDMLPVGHQYRFTLLFELVVLRSRGVVTAPKPSLALRWF